MKISYAFFASATLYNWSEMVFYLFTDGACQPNPGNGGWAFIIYPKEHPKKRVIQSGYEKDTTNNRMEITAVLKGLSYITKRFKVEEDSVILCSDSKYLLNGIKTWMHNWVKNDWKKKDKKPVLNNDLWKKIYSLSQDLEIECNHIHGHTGHPENEECDQLAVAQIVKHK